MSSIPARPHTFVEMDHEIFSTVMPLLLLIQEGLLSVIVSLPSKSVVRLTDRLDRTIAVDWDVKPQTKQTKSNFFRAKLN